jgi:hypothetical protein
MFIVIETKPKFLVGAEYGALREIRFVDLFTRAVS